MIRILHVVKELGSGGIEAVICNLYNNIDRSRVQFDFVMHWKEKGMHEDEVIALGARIYRLKNIEECGGEKKYKKQWKEFWDEHSKEYDVVHSHYMSHDGPILEMAKKYGKYTIAHSHSLKNKKFSVMNFYRMYINRNLNKYADYMMACSGKAGRDFFGDSFNENGIVLKNAIEIDEFGFNEEIRNKIRKENDLEQLYVVGHVGNYRPKQKNQDFMLSVFSQFSKECENACLVWAGNIREKDLDHVKALIKECEIEDKVILLGRCSNISEWMQAFDMFLFPSKSEGLGMVLIEAQATGLKCVTSDQIPEEAIVSKSTEVCKISDSYEIWANTMKKNMFYCRKDGLQTVKEAGYDVKDTAKFLEDFYLRILKD